MTLGAANDNVAGSVCEPEEFLRAALEHLPYGTALVDEAGRIVAADGGFQRFARESGFLAPGTTLAELDYLELCGGWRDREGVAASEVIVDVLSRRCDVRELVYPCHTPTQMRWCRINAERPSEPSLARFVAVMHSDVTEAFAAKACVRIQASVAKALVSQVPMLEACLELALAVCHELDWDYCGIWSIDLASWTLRCRKSWSRPDLHTAAFEAASLQAALEPGAGLPGRAWQNAQVQWATDLDVDASSKSDGNRILPPTADAAGFRTAVSFPLKCGDDVLAVVDVFSRVRRSPDPVLMDLLETLGSQLALWELGERAKECARVAQHEADDARARLESVLDCAPAFVLVIGHDEKIQFINRTLPNYRKEDVIGTHWKSYVYPDHQPRLETALSQVFATGQPQNYEVVAVDPEGKRHWFLNHMGPIRSGASVTGAVVIAQDVTDAKLAQTELEAAQRLASVGTLAAGVAHEINTPIQFVNDSIHFLRDASTDLFGLVNSLRTLKDALDSGAGDVPALLAQANEAEEGADLEYLLENVPKAFDRSIEGLERVATIVRSMKEFAHPPQKEMAGADLNRAILSTLTVARNEYKYLADLETDLAEIPLVTCHLSEINQVVLNLVVNAAHAIEDVVRGSERRGRITVCTRLEGTDVVISVADTGSGIPEHVRPRIFDPFFTTKEVGRGTGQGLAIARSAVREKHGGDLSFETKVGVGTTFFIRLPVQGKPASAKA
jgi:PAS domain S-box-containing protein